MTKPENILAFNNTIVNGQTDTIQQVVEVDENRPRPKSKRNPRDLVGLLLGYGARTRRSSAPKVKLSMEVFTPEGKHAVRVKFG